MVACDMRNKAGQAGQTINLLLQFKAVKLMNLSAYESGETTCRHGVHLLYCIQREKGLRQ
jgi:hypothetical protein